ncbi:hypothetical protein WS69_14615 [Burkholderia sp. BDU5]|nr:hypothetical protein WS45_29775 [Burkholderia sp. RF2-non_BP3]KVE35860.1 hypothetical protein WS69_14615 [Burkholderia sp. BDU5]
MRFDEIKFSTYLWRVQPVCRLDLDKDALAGSGFDLIVWRISSGQFAVRVIDVFGLFPVRPDQRRHLEQ